MSELEKDLLKLLGIVLLPFPVLLVIGFYYKYPVIGTLTVICGAIAVIAYLKRNKQIIKQKQQAVIDRLNRVSAQYDENSPASAITDALSDDAFDNLVRKIESHIVIGAATKVVDKYQDVLFRKRRQKAYQDDYGRENRAGWDKELTYFTKTILMPELTLELSTQFPLSRAEEMVGSQNYKEDIQFWCEFVDSHIELYLSFESTEAPDFDELMSGHEYEHYVAGLIRQQGWAAQVTSGSGDHGADIIAEKDGIRVAIQCKLYSSAVGNKSVQEAFSAQGFYDCHKSCVVTNNTFTNAARKAAYKLNVSLLHHDKLCDFLAELA